MEAVIILFQAPDIFDTAELGISPRRLCQEWQFRDTDTKSEHQATNQKAQLIRGLTRSRQAPTATLLRQGLSLRHKMRSSEGLHVLGDSQRNAVGKMPFLNYRTNLFIYIPSLLLGRQNRIEEALEC